MEPGFRFVVRVGQEMLLVEQYGLAARIVQLTSGWSTQIAGTAAIIEAKENVDNTRGGHFALSHSLVNILTRMIESDLMMGNTDYESVITIGSTDIERMIEIVPTKGADTYTVELRYFDEEGEIQAVFGIGPASWDDVVSIAFFHVIRATLDYDRLTGEMARPFIGLENFTVTINHPSLGKIKLDDVQEASQRVRKVLKRAKERRASQS